MIPQSFIQDLLHRVDIVDVVDRHVKLKRAGANYVACCPFHSEKSPSFTVSQTKQFYHCFGCGAHGTAISFLMEHTGLGFIDAVKELAQMTGMTVPEVRSDNDSQRREDVEELHEALATAARHFRSQLRDAPNAIDYLKRRGLSGEIAKAYGIGYAPDGWQNLEKAFSDYSAPVLLTAGLVKQNDEGRRYDVFRNRIMFPIIDVRGHVIGFGGRVLDSGEPKYLNSPETPVFEKGRELYGLFQARRAIRDVGRVIVVEGYMDVVALAQHGVEYAVATLGTATTPQHVQKLLRQTDEIVYCFDGDNAGRRAAWRALENSLAQLQDGKQLRFLFLPQGEDPDSYVRAQGREAFEKTISRSVPLSQFFIDELGSRSDMASAEGRAAFLHAAEPLLKQIPPNNFRTQLIREVAGRALVDPHELLTRIDPGRAQRSRAPAQAQRRPPPPHASKLLTMLVAHPVLAVRVSAERRAMLHADSEQVAVTEVLDLILEGGIDTTAGLIEATRNSENAAAFSGVVRQIDAVPSDVESAAAELEGLLAQIEDKVVRAEYLGLTALAQKTPEQRARMMELQTQIGERKGVPRK
jgi:DNA primase